jgi:S1-C subfamily serine protease
MPAGTGFFVSADGHFVTALHVVATAPGSSEIRDDLDQLVLQREPEPSGWMAMVHHGELVFADPMLDIALLKFDPEENSEKEFLKGREGFPHLDVSKRS